MSPAEKATGKDEVEIEKFLQAQKSKNSQYKTKSDLNARKKFCESMKGSRAIENIPANELDLPLSEFFIFARKHVHQAASSEVFNATCVKKEVLSTKTKTNEDAQLNFTKCFEAIVPKPC